MRKTTTLKSLFLAGVLAMFTLPIASAKSYDINLSSPTMVGNTQLKAGEYTLKVQGSNAVFINQDNGEKYMETSKVENATSKFENTAVETTRDGTTQYLLAIELGGSKTILKFN